MGPAVLLQVLRPFVVADGHAARVREEVGDHRDAALFEDPVGRRRGRLVGALDDDLAVDGARVRLFGDHAAERGGDEPVARDRPQRFVRDRRAARELGDGPPGRGVRQQRRDVEPLVVRDAAVHIRHGHDSHARLRVEQPCQVTADVAEPLDHDPASFERDSEVPGVLHHHVHHPPARGLLTSQRSAQRDGLAGHRRRRIAVAARVLVQDPGHHLGVGVHVRRRDVAVRPEHDGDALREAPGEALQLELGELLRVHRHAALRAAERDVHQRRLPCHDRREAQHLVVIRLGVVADPPLAWSARAVVLDAVPGEHLDAAVVHPHRHLDLDLAERGHQDAAHVLLEVDEVGGAVELTLDDGPPRHRAGTGGCGQGTSLLVRVSGGDRPSGPPDAALRTARGRR